MMKKWCTEFLHGQQSTKDDLCSKHLSMSITSIIVSAVEKLVLEDRSIIQCKIAQQLHIFKGSMHSVLPEHLYIYTKWVP
jgi:hypothetical protein